MITVKEAIQKVLSTDLPIGSEKVKLEKSKGRWLMQEIFADHDFPPFDRAMMDGYAIQFSKWNKGQRKFSCNKIQTAGRMTEIPKGCECIEIMTGAVVPTEFDCIIPVEQVIHQNEDAVTFDDDAICRIHQHIHHRATDRKKGDLLLSIGQFLGPQHIAILAANGIQEIQVKKRPRIAIIATGDELISIDQQPLPHQIRMSNGYALSALIQDFTSQLEMIHLVDDEQVIDQWLQEVGPGFDVLVFSGGVSKGKRDLLPEIWKSKGYEKIFHGVAQKPGKPMWFGKNERNIIFGLPGNPVSALFCARRYLVPWLEKNNGQFNELPAATFNHPVQNTTSLTQWIPIQRNSNGGWEKVVFNGSGDLNGLINAIGFIEIHPGEEKNHFPIFLF